MEESTDFHALGVAGPNDDEPFAGIRADRARSPLRRVRKCSTAAAARVCIRFPERGALGSAAAGAEAAGASGLPSLFLRTVWK